LDKSGIKSHKNSNSSASFNIYQFSAGRFTVAIDLDW
jgi:hypothetical protein